MSKIKCKVEECKHNKDCLCDAAEIEVRSSGTLKVCRPDETACETFTQCE
ncbi:MAG: DUF1540 domain-containing protein [Bacillota bacterium]|nr:DUF1540 domain-containing protein [Bacillota bacterium]